MICVCVGGYCDYIATTLIDMGPCYHNGFLAPTAHVCATACAKPSAHCGCAGSVAGVASASRPGASAMPRETAGAQRALGGMPRVCLLVSISSSQHGSHLAALRAGVHWSLPCVQHHCSPSLALPRLMRMTYSIGMLQCVISIIGFMGPKCPATR